MLGALSSLFSDAAIAASNRALDALALEHPLPPGARLIDVGCGWGEMAARIGARLGAAEIHGVEGEEEGVAQARARGVLAVQANLERPLPLESAHYDIVLLNQVIEHIVDLDLFVGELSRILKPGGALVLATPNLASWTNIAALVLGQQAFSQTISQRQQIGNRFSRGYGQKLAWDYPLHKHILTKQGIHDLLRANGLHIERWSGAGYFPLPPAFGRLDVRHAQYLICRARKR